MNADRMIRVATAGAVLAVAAFAAIQSFSHIRSLASAHSESLLDARLLPLSVDGLILAASLVLLHEARNGRTSPPLAWWLLGLGVAATVAANVAYGLVSGAVGALVAAWPAVAFIGSVELLMLLVRRARVPGQERVTDAPTAGNGVPGWIIEAQRTFAEQLAAGEVPTIRRIRSEMGVGSHRAQAVRAHLAALAGEEAQS
jgi:Protein of unknown function (DUF2637)